MIFMLFFGGFVFSNVSNLAHLGGFAGGCGMALLCGPSYRRSYAARRKNSLEVDLYNREYRSVMGFGIVPSGGGLVSLPVFWVAVIASLYIFMPSVRYAPKLVLRALTRPGSLP